jgi:hypothetical protein
MARKILTPQNVQTIMDMRSIVDEWGEPRYTGTELAVHLGVSESTIWRVIKKQAAYQKRILPSQAEEQRSLEGALAAVTAVPVPGLDAEAQTSLEKLQEKLREHRAKGADSMLDELSSEAQARLKEYK